MPFDVDPTVDKGRAKTVSLGGHDFTVCPLPLRQVLALADVMPKMKGITADTISSEKFEPAIDIIMLGLKKAHPGLTRDELLDLPIGLGEIMAAIPIIVEQAGGQRAAAAEAGAPAGE